jgi:hypothetical protein
MYVHQTIRLACCGIIQLARLIQKVVQIPHLSLKQSHLVALPAARSRLCEEACDGGHASFGAAFRVAPWYEWSMLHDSHALEENLLLMRAAEPLWAFGGSIRSEEHMSDIH